MTAAVPSVPAQPATPGQALRWYAARQPDVPEAQEWARQLSRWADELDARSPACHQPGVQPDWCGYLTHQAATKLREAGLPTLAGHVEDLERAHAAGNPEHLYGPRPGPLSTAPPAGTETDR